MSPPVLLLGVLSPLVCAFVGFFLSLPPTKLYELLINGPL